MDSLERKVISKYNKFKNMSLKHSLYLYVFISIIITIAITIVCNKSFEQWEKLIISRYLPDNYNIVHYTDGYIYTSDNEYIVVNSMTKTDHTILDIIDKARVIDVFIIAIICVNLSVKLYFKNKLQKPIDTLRIEAEFISNGDLTHECTHEYNDEMGEICNDFNNMRKALISQQNEIWTIVNAERMTKSAFIHDIRTPLTVLKGYNDLLLKFYPTGKISEEKLTETLELMNDQIMRLEKYSDTMKQVRTLEEIELNKKETSISELKAFIQNIAAGIENIKNINITCIFDIKNMKDNDTIYIDTHIVSEVLENLLSNALRYCEKRVDVIVQYYSDKLVIYAKDDGSGFSADELKKACQLYYSTSDDNSHYGLGLYICSLLAKKHGGRVQLNNSIESGAIVEVTFSTKTKLI